MTLDKYSWDEIKTISNELVACSSKEKRSKLAIQHGLRNPLGKLDGTQMKSVVFKDGNTAKAQLMGICHDENDRGPIGLSFIFKDCIFFGSIDSNPSGAGTWANSELRTYMNEEWIRWLPDDLLAVMVPARKTCTRSINMPESVSDLLWLPSLAEIISCNGVGWEESPFSIEGSQYELFLDNWNNSLVIQKQLEGGQPDPENFPWWLRSAQHNQSGMYRVVFGNVNEIRSEPARNRYGVAPCFCI